MQLNFSGLPRSLVIVSSSPPICTVLQTVCQFWKKIWTWTYQIANPDKPQKLFGRRLARRKRWEVNCIIKKLLGGRKSVDDVIHGSDAIVAVDEEGNICSMIHTINSQMWWTGLFAQRVALPHSAVNLRPSLIRRKARGEPCCWSSACYFFQNRELHTSSPSSYGSLSCRLMLDSKMNPKETKESPTFLLPSFSDFF